MRRAALVSAVIVVTVLATGPCARWHRLVAAPRWTRRAWLAAAWCSLCSSRVAVTDWIGW